MLPIQIVRKPPRIIMAGAPASGKGTQCEFIKEEFNVVHLSTGDMLRNECNLETEVGIIAKSFMDQGMLVPDEVMIQIVLNRIQQPDCVERGWLLDGFPRTEAQAEAMGQCGIDCDTFVNLDVPDEALIDRVIGRRSDPVTGKIYHLKFSPPENDVVKARLIQRSDDTEEKVKTRIKAFHNNMSTLLQRYKDKTLTVNGNRKPSEIWSDLYSSLSKIVKTSVIFVLGGPKSGKKSYCEMISNSFGYTYISIRELIYNQEVANRTSPEFSITIVEYILNQMNLYPNRKYVIDTFPRNYHDLRAWFSLTNDRCLIGHVVHLDCPDDVSRQRQLADDATLSSEEIQSRLDSFKNHTMPIIATFKSMGKLRHHASVSEVAVGFDLLTKLFERKNLHNHILQRTLVIIKPDAIRSGHKEAILQRIGEEKDVAIVYEQEIHLTREDVSLLYSEHSTKHYFEQLIEFMISGVCHVIILDGQDIARRWRVIMGPTSPETGRVTHPKSLRAIYGTDTLHNALHGSDNEACSFHEIDFFTKRYGHDGHQESGGEVDFNDTAAYQHI